MARARRKAPVRLLGVVRRRRPALLLSTALCATVTMVVALPAEAQPAPNAHPTGGVVSAGSAAISQTANQTSINQSSQNAAINWQSFNVGSQQSVQFNQPSASALTLNRVVGPDPSQIAGRIDANGQVILVNQSGVTFYKGAQVNTAGLMVSAAGITDKNFMAGNMKFDQPALPNAKVENQGNITIRQAGLAALVAPQVRNSGTITAKLGHVVLAGAKAATVDLYGDGLLSIDVSGQVVQAPNGATALVTNTGVIQVAGGTVQLTARAADGIVQTLVEAGGKISAPSVGDRTGRIALNGVGGSVIVEGQLSAVGHAPASMGGSIEVNATGNVTVASTARINASGKAGGGVVAIGTTLQRAAGGPGVTPTQTAAKVVVQKGARIAADATAKGSGGRVTLLSTDTTQMAGTITATGGPAGGDGGFIEISGQNLGITGSVDVGAPAGAIGTILLDPDYLNIVAGSAGSGTEDANFAANTGTVKAGDGLTATPDSIANGVINSFTGNVLLQANKTLTVAAPISLTTNPGQSLTLEAGGTLTINSGIAVTASGDVILATGGAGPFSPPAAQASPLISLLGTVASTGGSVSLLAGAGGTVSIGAAGSLAAATGQRVTLQMDTLTVAAGGKVSAPSGTLEIAPASALAIHLGTTGGLALPQATLNAMSANVLRLGAATVAGTLTQTATAVSIGGAISLSGIASTLDLQSTGAVTQTAALSNVGTLTGSTGAVTLTSASNAGIGTIGSYTVGSGGDFNLTETGSLAVTGPLSAHNISLNSATLAASGSVIASALMTLTAGTGGIALNTGAVLSATTVDVLTTGGGITQSATGTITATLLHSTAGIAGGLSLSAPTNSITNVGPITVSTGDIAIVDKAVMLLGGTISATAGNVYLQSTNPLGINFGTIGVVKSVAGGIVGLQANKVSNLGAVGAKGVVNVGATGTFEMAPNTAGSLVTLGTASGFSLTNLTGITAGTLRIGAVTVPGSGLTTTAGSINIAGTGFNASGVTTLELDAGTVGVGTGGVGQTAGLLNVATLAGTAVSIALLSSSNTIAALDSMKATGSNVAIADSAALAIAGTVSAVAGNVYLQSSGTGMTFGAAGAIQSVAGGRIGLQADALTNLGTTGATGAINAGAAGTFELAPNTIGQAIALGSVSGLSLANRVGITAGKLRVGAVTLPGTVSPTTRAGAIHVAGSFDLGSSILDLEAAGAVTQAAALTNVSTLLGTAPSFALTNAANSIGAIGALTATAGDIAIADNAALTIAGGVTATVGNVYLQSAQPGGISFGAAGAIQSVAGGVIGLQADAVANLGTTGATGVVNAGATGTFELAPNTAGATMSLGTAFGLSLANVTGITAGTMRIGGVTQPGSAAATVLAGSINVGGTFDAANATLDLQTTGSVTQTAPLLNVATLSGTVAAATLTNAGNTIGAIGTLKASAGNIAIADATALTVAGLVNAAVGNIYLQSSHAGGIGFGAAGTLQSVAGGRIGLQTDALLNLGTTGATGVVDAGSGGTFELAPNSGAALTLGTASGLSLSNLTGITAGTIRVGGVTAPGGTAPTTTATSINVAGAFDLGGDNLDLLTNGAVTQSAALTNVGTLSGQVGSVTLTNTGNAIAALGTLVAATGDIPIYDGAALTVAGLVQASTGNVFLQSSNAGGITINGTVQSVAGGRIGLQADALVNLGTTGATGVVNAGTTGTVELAPNTTGNTITLGNVAGLSLSNLTGITAGTLRIGAVTLPGGSLPTITAGAVAVTGTFNGSGIATLELDAVKGVGSGAVTQTAPLLNIGTLVATADSFSLTNPNNSVGTLGALTGTGAGSDFVVNDATAATIAGTLSLAGGGTLTVNAPSLTIGGGSAGVIDAGTLVINTSGSISETANGTLIVNTLSLVTTSPGDVILGNKNNQIANLSGASVSNGNLVVVDDPTLTLTGAFSANNLFFQVTQAGDTIALGAGTPATLTSTLGSGGRISLIADNLTRNAASTITATNGTVEIAPFSSSVSMSLAGASQLLVDTTLLSNISTGTLVVGRYTDVNNGNSVSITAAGISLDGVVDLTGHANALLLASLGTITQPGGSLVVGTLGGTAAAISLNAVGNDIATLGAVATGNFNLVDGGNAGNLTVAGPVTATQLAISNAGTISVTGSIDVTTTLALAAGNGGIALNAGGVLSAATVDLSASGGGVTQAAAGTITATVLQSNGGVAGSVDLAGTANAVATVGSFAVTGGDFSLVDTGNLSVAGALTANNISLASATITAAGSIGATGLLALAAGSGGIALNAGEVLSGATVDLSASNGGVTQVATGTILATTLLQSTSGVTGTVNLAGTANQIASIGSFSVTSGDFNLTDTGNLGVAGRLTADNIALGSATITATGSIGANTALVLAAGNGGIALNTGAVLSGATVDLSASGGGVTQVAAAQITATTLLQSASGVTGTVNLAGTTNAIASIGSFAVSSGDFNLVDTGNLLLAGKLTAGNISLSAPTITATGSIGASGALALASGSGGIALNSGDVLSGATIDLSAAGGGVTQAAGGTLIATSLQSASGVTGTVNLAGTANAIASIGSFAVTGGDFALVDTGNLDVAGRLTASNITLDSPTITATGSIGATNLLALSSGGGGIGLNAGAVLSGATVDLSTTGGGVTQVATGTIATTLLQSTGGVSGTVNLAGTANAVASIGSFAVSGGDFVLVDTGNLLAAGKLTAGNIRLASSTITATGSVGALGTLAMAAGTGGILLNTGEILSGATVDLSATGGGVTQVATGTIAAATLQSTSGVTGTVNLAGTANAIGSIGAFAVTGGDFNAVDTGNLTIAGALTANNISLASATITAAGSIGATGLLALAAGGGGIALNAGDVLSAATIDLSATGGGVTQITGGTITASVLQSASGVTGTVNLAGSANNVAAVGSFAVTGGNFVLVDNGNAGNLTLAGPLSAANVAISDASTGTISVAGSIGATTTLALSSGSGGIRLNTGAVLSSAVVDLSTTGGGVTQVATGTISTGTLQSASGVVGTVSLPGSGNAIASVGSFAVTSGDFDLVDTGNLALAGKLTAANLALTSTTITATGSVGATTALVLAAGSGGISLNGGAVLSGATVDVSAAGGGVTEVATGTIAAALLQSSSGVTGTVNLAGTANNIAAVGAFAVSTGDFALVDNGNAGNLALTGPITATNVTISDANTGTISVAGSIGATAVVALSSGSGGIRLNTGEVLSGTTVDLSTTGGGVTQVATGSIAAATLQSTSGIVGTVNLAGTANSIGSVGSLAVSSGDFALVDTGNLVVAGRLTAGNITLDSPTITAIGSIGATAALVLAAGAGGIALNTGEVLSGATIDLAATGGGVTQVATGTLNTTTLQSASGVVGSVSLAGTANAIASIGSFAVTSGDFTLVDGAALGVAGGLTAANISLTGPTISATGSVGATTALLLSSGAGGIQLNAGAVLSGTTVDLATSGGGVTQVASGVINATTLQSGAGVVGTVNLAGTANSIGSIGSFAVTGGGDFNLVDTGNLAVAGKLTAANIALHGPTITATGSIGAVGALALASGGGGIRLNAGANLSGTTVDFSTSGGGVTQVAGSGITAALLQSTSGVVGTVSLPGTANAIASIGSFAVSGGDFSLTDTGNLSIAGTLTAGNVALSSTTITATGSIGAANALVLSAGGGGIQLNAGDVLSGSTIDLAATGGGVTQAATGSIAATVLQSTSGVTGTVNLAGTANAIAAVGSFAVSAGDFDLVDTGNLTVAGRLTATNISLHGPTITATGSIGATGALVLAAGGGGIALNAGDVLSGATLDLSTAGGGVTQVATGIITATTLQSASGVVGSVNLAGTANNIGTIGSFGVTGGNFALVDNGNAGNLAVTGPLTAANVTLSDANTGTISVAGSIGATTALVLASGSGGIRLDTGHVLSGATVDLSSTGGGVTQVATGTIIATSLLQSAGGVSGTVSLAGTANDIAAVGSFAVTGGDFTLVDNGNVGNLAVTGPLTANNVTLGNANTGTISVAGSIGASNTISISAGSGGIRLNAGEVVSGATVDLATTGGGVIQATTGTLIASTLLSTAGVVGGVNLAGTANSIGALGGFSASSFTLTDHGPLSINGTVSAASIGLTADSISIPGVLNGGSVALVATTGSITETGVLIAGTLTGSSSGATSLTGATPTSNQIGMLGSFSTAGFTLNDGLALTVSGPLNAGASAVIVDANALNVSGSLTASGTVSLTGSSLALSGSVTDGGSGATTLIATAGGITETGTLIVGTLRGSSTGATSLTGATTVTNQIGTLGSFTAAGFTLNDGVALSVAGVLNGSSVATLLDKGALAIGGTVTATSIGLTGDSISIPGVLNGGAVVLTGTTGAISATGTIIAGTLSGSAVTGASLTNSANNVGTLGAFAVSGGDFTLVDNGNAGNLAITGPVIATNLAIRDANTGTISVGGSIGATDVLTLAAGSGGIALNAGDVLSAATIDLTTTGGGVTQIASGTIAATALLQSTGGVTGTVSLAGTANNIAAVGAFAVSGGNFALVDNGNSGNLLLSGPLSATSVSVSNANTGTISVTGSIGASTTLALASGSGGIALNAGEVLSGATVDLSTTGGGVTQIAGGTINATTLQSSSGVVGGISLPGAGNSIGSLGTLNVTTGDIAISDNAALTIAGLVRAVAGNVTLQTPNVGGITINGTLQSVAGGRIGLQTDALANLGTTGATGVVNAGTTGTFELAPSTAGRPITLGSASGLSLTNRTGITAGTLRIGAVTLPGSVAPTINAGAINVAGAFDLGGSNLDLQGSGAVTQSAALTNVATLTGHAPDFTLTNAGNAISAIGSLTASAGTIAITDTAALTLAGTLLASAGNVFLQTSNAGGITFGAAGAVQSVTNGVVGMQADAISNLGSTGATGTINTGAAGTFELAPNTAGATLTLGAASGLSLSNRTGITAGLLRIGGVTQPGSVAPTIRAGSIAVAGAFDLGGNRLDLLSAGGIGQTAALSNVGTLTGKAATVALTNPGNTIATLGAFSTSSGFALTDNQALLVNAAVTDSGATSTLALTTTGDLTLAANLSAANTLALVSTGSISQTAGSLSAASLTGSATGSASLTAVSNLIGTLGAFSTGNGFALVDNQALLVAGPVTDTGAASTLALTTKSGNLTLAGNVSATHALDLVSAGSISQSGGSVSAGTLTGQAGAGDFALTGATNQIAAISGLAASAGNILLIDHAPTLTLSGTSQAGLIYLVMNAPGGNLQLGSNTQGATLNASAGGSAIELVADRITEGAAASTIAATSGLASVELAPFTAGTAVSLAGSTGSHLLLDTTLLNDINTGTITVGRYQVQVPAGGSNVTAGDIAIDGPVSLPGHATTLQLFSQGSISEPTGTLVVGTLTGSAVGSASLTQAANLVGTLAAFSTGAGFSLTDSQALQVTGPVTDTGTGSTLTLDDTAGGLNLAGNVSATNRINLVSAGTISQTSGSISAGTLTGSAALSVTLNQADNSIGTLGDFTAAGFSLNNAPALSVAGNVDGGASLTIVDAASLNITGAITATAIGLTASGISIPGSVNGSSSVTLTASAAGISETGSIATALLTGHAATGASLTGSNSIATLGSFTATGGLVLDDNAALTVTGPVTAAAVTISDADAIAVSGSIAATSTLAMNAGNGGILLNGGAVVSGPTINLNGGAGGISLSGNATLGSAGGLIDLTTTGGVSEAAGSTITTGRLQSGNGVTGNVALLGTGNAIATLGDFAVTAGDLSLIDTGNLSVVGAVNANNVTLTGSGAGNIAVSNSLGAAATLTITSGSGGISLGNGAVVTAPTIDLNGNGGAIALTGNASLGSSLSALDLTTSAGGVSEAVTATIDAATLTSRSGVGGDVSLAGTANAVATMGNFTVNGGNFALTDNGSLAFNGALTAHNITVSTGGTGAITSNAAVSADAGNGTLTLISGSGGIAVKDGGSLRGATIDLSTTGGGVIEAPAGIISTGLLRSSGGVAGTVDLPGLQNAIASIGNLTVLPGSGTFSVYTTGALTVAGTLSALAISLEAVGDISIPGAVIDPPIGNVSLVSDTGGISEVGSLVAALLTGSSANTTSLTGSNQVAELGNFSVGNGAFVLHDSANLLISGVVSAATINIGDSGFAVTLGDGAGFITGGLIRPQGSLTIPNLPPGGTSSQGAYITAGDVIQLGSSSVTGLGGEPSILDINVSGNVAFDPTKGLQAPGTWLELNLVGGQASGAINVKALDISYVLPTAGARLTATIDGLTGQAAAGSAFIEPRPNANFQLDGCPIHSVNCVLLPSQSLPAASPVNDIFFGSLFNPQDQGDLLLPIVSDRDY